MKPYTMGSLFAGIGGFDLGFERAEFKTVWQVEQNEYCRKVLAKNFPDADRSVTDVRDAGSHNLAYVDVICGGFPCQDISNAGLRGGIAGARSGLWKEFARIIRELRPAYVLVENVAALLGRGLGVVLGDLAEIGYDAEWDIVSCCMFGAPHTRERVFLMAYPSCEWWGQRRRFEFEENIDRKRDVYLWPDKPCPLRVVDGVPRRMERLGGYGNSVMPQIPEMYARRIKQALDAQYLILPQCPTSTPFESLITDSE